MKWVSFTSSAAVLAFCSLAAAPAYAVGFNGSIEVAGGKCLDVHAPDMTHNGGRVQVWSCNGQPQQIWQYNSASGTIRNQGGLCLDAHAPDMETNGGRVQVWACNSAGRSTPAGARS